MTPEGDGYTFGDVRVDLRRMQVVVRGAPVAVEPKSFDVLRYLLRHRDRLVTKEELMHAVWGDTFVTPNVLTRAIAQLRRALDDDAQDARYIETVSRRGYRFLPPVEVMRANGDGAVSMAAAPPVLLAPPAVPAAVVSRRRWPVAVLGAAALVLLAAAAWWALRRPDPPATPARAFALPNRVTTRKGLNSWPTLSPDGRSVAYVSDRSGSFEIYVASLAPGGREITITTGMQTMHPDWSPDGQSIAFHSRARGGVWVVPATGGVAQQVVEFGSDPAWSPDGQSIVFTSDAGGVAAHSSLWSTRRDGTGRKELTRIGEPPGGHREPSWSADGSRIVFNVSRGGWGQEIFTVPAAGGSPRRLAAPRIGGMSPRFAPDGRALYWGSPSTGATGGSIWRLALDAAGAPEGEPAEVMDIGGYLDGLSIARDGTIAYGVSVADTNLWAVDVSKEGAVGEAVRLTHDLVRSTSPEYTADGRVAYAQLGPGRPVSVWLMNDDGTGLESLIAETPVAHPQSVRDGRMLVTRLSPPPPTYWWVDPRTRRLSRAGALEDDMVNARVSPDGRDLAFHVIESTGRVNVWTKPLDGSAPRRRLTSDAEVASYPSWSPDGRWLSVELKRGDYTHVGVVSRDGGPVEQLTFDDGQSWAHSWSPDGGRIALAGERQGIWNVFAVDRATRKVTRLTRFTSPSGYVRYPVWSPRGHRIVFERSIRESSVWTARPAR